ncbi:MAG: hypothetical protein H6Q43_514, partial [Deltaproteobacteria bacterium]|nr:hypothetical protein [Deltaproteobacteria bacterium]
MANWVLANRKVRPERADDRNVLYSLRPKT